MKAFINDNMVKMLKDISEEGVDLVRHHYQVVVDTDTLPRYPGVGWVYKNGKCYPEIPSVTPRQIRQALILSGITRQQVEDGLNSLPEPQKSLALVEWEYSLIFDRGNDLVSQVAAMLGWNEDQLDQLWIFAGKL